MYAYHFFTPRKNVHPTTSSIYGFVQDRGGPCGILAAVQAHLIMALAFGIPDVDDTAMAVNPLAPTDRERTRALAGALVAVLRRAAGKEGRIVFAVPSNKVHFTGVGR